MSTHFPDTSPEAEAVLIRLLRERQWASRVFERAVDPHGLSTTARAVLDRVPWLDQLGSR